MSEFIAFDLETTGMVPGVDQIVEVGAVRFIDGKPINHFASLVDPLRSIPAGASRVNGITDDMVKGKPTIDTLLNNFSDYCGDTPLVAHNANFDYQFLLSDYKKFEELTPTGIVFDTLPISRKTLPGLFNYKLATIAKHLNIETGVLHRADDDARYCGFVFHKLIVQIFGATATPNWERLIEISGRKKLMFPHITKQPKQLGLF